MRTYIKNYLKIVNAICLSLLFLFSPSIFSPAIAAEPAHKSSDFNHMKTGFPLTGVHASVACETCHVGGVFKGTDTACEGCHSPGRRVTAPFKPVNHMLTIAACNTCHTNAISFLGARFNHIGVQPGACVSCHNGNTAPAKPSGHVVTTSSCDTCHRSSAWIPAGFDHLSASPAVTSRCNQCHDGVQALGKYPQHVPTPSPSCDSAGCHTNTRYITFAGLGYDHVNAVPGNCGTCHTGQTVGAKTQTPGHIPYTGNGCDNCHTKPAAVGTGSFYPARMNHPVVMALGLSCTTCHSGAYVSQGANYGGAKTKTAGHVTTTAQCNVCHHDPAYASFVGGVMDHTGIINNCTSCHGVGTNGAKMKTPGVHIPTTNSCESCHTTSVFTQFNGTGATMNHAVETGQACTICHTGGYTSQGAKQGGAAIKPALHVTTSLNCLSCHTSYTSWSYPVGEKMDHTSNGNTTNCKLCHNTTSTFLGDMTKKTIPGHEGSKSTEDCISCHTNRYTSWNKP